MKVIIVFALAIASSYAALDDALKAQILATVKEIGAECTATEKASGGDMDLLMEHKIPSTREGQCMMACFNEHFGIQSPDGKPTADGARAALAPFKDADADIYAKMNQLIDTCFPQVTDTGDRCENAVLLGTCAHRVGKELGLTMDLIM